MLPTIWHLPAQKSLVIAHQRASMMELTVSYVSVVRRADFIRFFLVTLAFAACIILAVYAPGETSGVGSQAAGEASHQTHGIQRLMGSMLA